MNDVYIDGSWSSLSSFIHTYIHTGGGNGGIGMMYTLMGPGVVYLRSHSPLGFRRWLGSSSKVCMYVCMDVWMDGYMK